MRFHIVTLGCPKNETDSEGMETLLTEAGHCPVELLSEADLVVVNTCGFIDAARDESMAALEHALRDRRAGSRVVAAGCLAQREGDRLAERLPGLDAIVGCRDWTGIARVAGRLDGRSNQMGEPVPVVVDGELQFGPASRKPRPGSAYLKISDGCNASCSFCAIPSIKGPHTSKPRRQVIEEARALARGGASELVLVGQDTTAYGQDLGQADGLAGLLSEIAEAVPDIPWIRVMYLYPQRITDSLLHVLASTPNIVRYVDIPLQHTHPAVLRRMARPQEVTGAIERLREAMPDVAIRTTFIVGFPGETEEEHRHLIRSIKRLEFDRVGVFQFSPQAGTAAAGMSGQVPPAMVTRRWREAMQAAQQVSLRRNRKLVGKVLDVLVEGSEATAGETVPMLAGRSYRDAPEVDGLVFFEGRAEMGSMVQVRVKSAMEYDLVGEMLPAGAHSTARTVREVAP